MMTTCRKIEKELERVARNCSFYDKEGDIPHFVNEVGCLRGMMYLADIIGVSYPFQQYYELYIKPCAHIMETSVVTPFDHEEQTEEEA